jgi:SAM-dependent methyltransferase
VSGRSALSQALPALRDIVRALLWPQPEPVKRALRSLLDEVRLARATTAAAPQFAALRGEKGLLLHLGCGNHLKDGWVNLDLNLNGTAPELPPQRLPQTRFILYDLRSGTLPLDDESCELIYSSHFFEHLEHDDGVRLMRDCHRVLQPGGTFRAALPDFPELFRAYLERDEKCSSFTASSTFFRTDRRKPSPWSITSTPTCTNGATNAFMTRKRSAGCCVTWASPRSK